MQSLPTTFVMQMVFNVNFSSTSRAFVTLLTPYLITIIGANL